MNVVTVLGIAVVGYFIFVALWITKIEDYLNIGEASTPEDANAE